MKTKYKTGIFLILLSLLFLPLTFGLLGWFVTSPGVIKRFEQRDKNTWPDFPTSKKQIKLYPRKIESWFNDSFGLRSILIRGNGLLKTSLAASPNPSKVIIGKEGWLFLGNRWANTLNQSLGRDLFEADEIDQYVKAIERRSKWLAARGIPMVFVIAPDKNNIYPEYLPSWADTKGKMTRRLQLRERIGQNNFAFVDTTESVRRAKKHAPTFFKTDSHWNDYGAYIGYRSVMEYLRIHIGDNRLKIIGQSGFETKIWPTKGVSLPQMIGLRNEDLEDQAVAVQFDEKLERKLKVKGYNGQYHSASADRLKIGKQVIKTIRNTSLYPNGLKVLILRDSFTTNMSPYLNLSFGETTYCAWAQAPGKEMTRLVSEYDIDLVLWIMVERCLKIPQRIHHNWAVPDGRTLDERLCNNKIKEKGTGKDLVSKIFNPRGIKINGTGELITNLSKEKGIKLRRFVGEKGKYSLSFKVNSEAQSNLILRYRIKLDGGIKKGYRTALLMGGENEIFFDLPENALMCPIQITSDKKNRCIITDWSILYPGVPKKKISEEA